ITPACAYVSPLGAVVIGLVSGAASALAVNLKTSAGPGFSIAAQASPNCFRRSGWTALRLHLETNVSSATCALP
ncbi:hypothetical protein, partial [Micrococcus luteus]|uniref:hypothetical protein n=1 Tax=Micrococcus luteus TaxID=1270 RepID=UPI0033FD3BE8